MEKSSEQLAWYGPFRARVPRRQSDIRFDSAPLCAPIYGRRRRRSEGMLLPRGRRGALFISNEMLNKQRQQLLNDGLQELLEEVPRDIFMTKESCRTSSGAQSRQSMHSFSQAQDEQDEVPCRQIVEHEEEKDDESGPHQVEKLQQEDDIQQELPRQIAEQEEKEEAPQGDVEEESFLEQEEQEELPRHLCGAQDEDREEIPEQQASPEQEELPHQTMEHDQETKAIIDEQQIAKVQVSQEEEKEEEEDEERIVRTLVSSAATSLTRPTGIGNEEEDEQLFAMNRAVSVAAAAMHQVRLVQPVMIAVRTKIAQIRSTEARHGTGNQDALIKERRRAIDAALYVADAAMREATTSRCSLLGCLDKMRSSLVDWSLSMTEFLADSSVSMAERAVQSVGMSQEKLSYILVAQRVAAIENAVAVAAVAWKCVKLKNERRKKIFKEIVADCNTFVSSTNIEARETIIEENDDEDDLPLIKLVPRPQRGTANKSLRDEPKDDDTSYSSDESESNDIGCRISLVSLINKRGTVIGITKSGRRKIDFDNGETTEMPLDAIRFLDEPRRFRPTKLKAQNNKAVTIQNARQRSRKKSLEYLAIGERIKTYGSNGKRKTGTLLGYHHGWVQVKWDEEKQSRNVRRASIARHTEDIPQVKDNLLTGENKNAEDDDNTAEILPTAGKKQKSCDITLDDDFPLDAKMAALFDDEEDSGFLSSSSSEDIDTSLPASDDRPITAKTSFPELVKGIRVASKFDERRGILKQVANKNGWTRVLWDGCHQVESVRPSTLRVASEDESGEEDDEDDEIDDHDDDDNTYDKSLNFQSLNIGDRVKVLNSGLPRTISMYDGTVIEIESSGIYTIQLEKFTSKVMKLRSVQFQVLNGVLNQEESPQSSITMRTLNIISQGRAIPWSELPKATKDLQFGDRIVVLADLIQPSLVGQRGYICNVTRIGGWYDVKMDDGRYRSFRFPDLSRIPTESNENKEDYGRFPVGYRVEIIDDNRNVLNIGKIGVVTYCGLNGWRRVRMETNRVELSYRCHHLDDADRKISRRNNTDDDRNYSTSSSEENGDEIKEGTRVLVHENGKQIEALVVDVSTQGLFKVIVNGDHEARSYRGKQLVIDHDATAANKVLGRIRPSRIKEAVIGSRIRVTDEELLSEWYDNKSIVSSEKELGTGTIIEIGHSEWFRIKLDNGQDLSARISALRYLDKKHDENNFEESPQYEHIDTMHISRKVRAMLKEEANRLSGNKRRAIDDDHEPPQCQCISREEWINRLRRELSRRRRLEAGEGLRQQNSNDEKNEEEINETFFQQDEIVADGKNQNTKRIPRRGIDNNDSFVDIDMNTLTNDEVKFMEDLESRRHEERIGIDCDEHCMNRISHIECTNSVCAIGEQCRNRCFQRRDAKPVNIIKTPHCGWGLCAHTDIATGEFVLEAIGELIDEETAQKRFTEANARGDKNFYMIGCKSSSGLIIDATKYGNESRFINHSCTPNCELAKWQIGDEERYGVFALRRLRKGDDITIDYRYQSLGKSIITNRVCKCGASNCVGLFTRTGDKSMASVIPSTKRQRISSTDIERANSISRKKSSSSSSSSSSNAATAPAAASSRKRQLERSTSTSKTKRKKEQPSQTIPLLFPCALSQPKHNFPKEYDQNIHTMLNTFFDSLLTENAFPFETRPLMSRFRRDFLSKYPCSSRDSALCSFDILNAYRAATFKASLKKIRDEDFINSSNKRIRFLESVRFLSSVS